MAEIERTTGLVGFIVVGGPEPRCNGNMMVLSYVLSFDRLEQLLMALRAHTGKTIGGLDFSENYDGWNSSVEEPFVAHLNDIFCKGALLVSAYLCIHHPLAHEACLARALPKRATQNTPALPRAESNCLSENNFVGIAPSEEVVEEEGDGSHGPGSTVGAFSLGRK